MTEFFFFSPHFPVGRLFATFPTSKASGRISLGGLPGDGSGSEISGREGDAGQKMCCGTIGRFVAPLLWALPMRFVQKAKGLSDFSLSP